MRDPYLDRLYTQPQGYDWKKSLGDVGTQLGLSAIGATGQALEPDNNGSGLDDELKRKERISTEVAQQSTYPQQVMKSNLAMDQMLAQMGPAYAPLRVMNFMNLYGQAIPYFKGQTQLNVSRALDPFGNAYSNTKERKRKFSKGWDKIAGMFGNAARGGATAIGNMLRPGDQRGLF